MQKRSRIATSPFRGGLSVKPTGEDALYSPIADIAETKSPCTSSVESLGTVCVTEPNYALSLAQVSQRFLSKEFEHQLEG